MKVHLFRFYYNFENVHEELHILPLVTIRGKYLYPYFTDKDIVVPSSYGSCLWFPNH